jgi:shikimate dehydrogenase
MENLYGLIGHPLGHSFSKGYFTEKFEKLGLQASHRYELFDIESIELLPEILAANPQLRGLNATIPYKQAILPYVDELDPAAAEIGAVNTVKILPDGRLKGYNTDYWGFRNTLESWPAFGHIKPQKALVLGKGGAAKAVVVALRSLGVEPQYVSRLASADSLSYEQLTPQTMAQHLLIVNTTPLGMYPNTASAPAIPYQLLGGQHLLYDLVYNPLQTQFLQKGLAAGAYAAHEGLAMLHGQAEKAWQVWNAQ